MADPKTTNGNKGGPQTAERPTDVNRGESTYSGRNTDFDANATQSKADGSQTGKPGQDPGRDDRSAGGQGQRQGSEPQGQGTRQGGEEQGDQTRRSPAQQKGAQPDGGGCG